MMARTGVTEILESLGLRDHAVSGHRKRAVFHYEPVLQLYKLEIPSLFGRLLKEEGIFLDRADAGLFQSELDDLLTELGPLIWPVPGQGPRDHLLKPAVGSRYTSDLAYPRDKVILTNLLRELILAKQVRPGADIDALIEKRHKDAKKRIFRKTSPSQSQNRTEQAVKGDRAQKERQGSRTDESSDVSGTTDGVCADAEGPVVLPATRSRIKAREASVTLQVALRIFQKITIGELPTSGPSFSYGTIFIDGTVDSALRCFAEIDQHTGIQCAYVEFHPPEDMSLKSRIRIDRGSDEADETFGQVFAMLRDARRFPGEPSYRTVEVEVG